MSGSGFLYYNSVYLWPKLLAASFFLVALIPFSRAFIGGYHLGTRETMICAAAATLALLSHGGVAYSLVPLVIVALFRLFSLFSVRSIVFGGLTAAVLYAPWVAYTQFVDPNNSKLLKLHLTDGNSDSTESFATMFIRSYRNITFNRWANNRLENIETMAGSQTINSTIMEIARGVWDARSRTQLEDHDFPSVYPARLHFDLVSLGTILRVDQREFALRTLGIFNLAWLILPFVIFFANSQRRLARRAPDISAGA